jgi:ABC-type glycerol-3-phosphate transport system substrate-binding protein
MSRRAFPRRRFLAMSGGLAAGALATRGPFVALASHLDTAADATTLTFWWPGGDCGMLPFSAMTRDYERHHPGVHIPQVQCGTGKQDFITALLARIAAGSPRRDVPVGHPGLAGRARSP